MAKRGIRRSLFVVILLAYVGWLVVGLAGSGVWMDTGAVSDIASAGVTYMPRHQVFVLSEGRRFVAFSAVSPHQGNIGIGFEGAAERVLYCATNQTFVEQFHGSIWDRRGRYVAGPAPRGLTTVAVRILDGRVEVAPSRWSLGLSRYPRGRPGLGALCMGDVVPEVSPGFAGTVSFD